MSTTLAVVSISVTFLLFLFSAYNIGYIVGILKAKKLYEDVIKAKDELHALERSFRG